MAPEKRKPMSKPVPLFPLPQNPEKFVMKVAKDDYQFLNHTPFVFERGFTNVTINFANLLQGRRSWKKLCE